jgi:hypothetical protein
MVASMAGAEGEVGGALIAAASWPANFYRSRAKARRAARLRAVSVRTEGHQPAVAIDGPAVCTEGKFKEDSESARSRFKIGPFHVRHVPRLPCP